MENDTKLIECPRDPAQAPWQELRCHWAGSMPKESGRARMYWDDVFLHVEAELFDSDIFSTATDTKQRTWELGDVCEIFVMPNLTREDYFEFHVTPNNILLDLQIPRADKKEEGWTRRTEFNSNAETGVTFLESMWKPRIAIPWKTLEIVPEIGRKIKIAACRYNYTRTDGDWGDPECSSTAPFSVFSFHRPEEFSLLLLRS